MKAIKLLFIGLFTVLFCQLSFAGNGSPSVSTPVFSTAKVKTEVSKSPTKKQSSPKGFFKRIKEKSVELNWLGFIVGIFIPIVTMWKLFTKADIPGWWSLIPIGNMIMYLKIIDKKWTNIFWLLVPIANIIFLIIWDMDMAEHFGKERLFGLGIFFLFSIFAGLIAWEA